MPVFSLTNIVCCIYSGTEVNLVLTLTAIIPYSKLKVALTKQRDDDPESQYHKKTSASLIGHIEPATSL